MAVQRNLRSPAHARLISIAVACALVLAGCSKRSSPGDEGGASRSGTPAAESRESASGAAGGWTSVPAGGPPLNLVLLTLDTTRRDRLSCYGYDKKTTPNLDRLAEEGILFEQAYAAAPVTLPSHATMMTGLYPFQNGVRNNGTYVLADSITTLAELMEAKGYRTGAVLGAFPVDHRFGLAQGFRHYDDLFPPTPAREGESAERPAADVTRLSLEWIDAQAGGPFFLWAHYYDPHTPYHPPDPWKSRFPDQPYDGELASMDASIGELVEGIRSRGLLDRTVLLVAGDHGEGLGDHDEPTHSMFLYGATLESPLLLRVPDAGSWRGGAWHGKRVRGLVGLIDVFPTAWNVLGFSASDLPAMAGRSLLPLVEGTGAPHERLYHETLVPDLDYGMSELRGLLEGDWKYIRAPRPEIYDLAEDPDELVNRAEEEKDRVRAMESQLAEILKDEVPAYAPMAIDQETLEKLQALGYMQGGAPAAGEKRADPKDMTGVGRATARAMSLAEASRTEEALAVLDSLLAVRPETRLALRLRAVYLSRLGRGPESLKAFAAALADCAGCPDEFRLLQDQANAYLVAGEIDEALRRTQVLLKARPEERGLYLLLGEILEKKGDPEHALEAYTREAEISPREALPLVRAGNVYASLSRLVEAEKSYRQALAVSPKNADALVMLSELLEKTGRGGEAEGYVDQALSADPNSTIAHYRKGWILRSSGRKQEAIQHFRAAEEGDPRNGRLLYELGSLYDELGSRLEAAECYRRAVQAGNAPAGAYANLGVSAAQEARYQEAIKLWNEALRHNPTAAEDQIIRGYIGKAEELMRAPGAPGR